MIDALIGLSFPLSINNMTNTSIILKLFLRKVPLMTIIL